METPLDLSKKLQEQFANKSLESPLDLSQKTVMTSDERDTKPCHLLGQTLQYCTSLSYSSVPTTQPKWLPYPQSSMISATLPVSVQPTMATTLVQKVSPVRPQTYNGTTSRQNSSTKTCIVAATQRQNHVASLSECRSSDSTDHVKSTLPASRNVSVVKPAASPVSDTQLLSVPVNPAVIYNSLLASQLIHTNQKVISQYGTVTSASFDTCRTDCGWPLAQVHPSRVVTSTAQNTVMESVPSPAPCNKELRKSTLNRTRLLDSSCPSVSAASSLSISKTSSHVTTSSHDNCKTVTSPEPVPITSADVSPTMPILSPNIPGNCFVSCADAVSPEPYPSKSTFSRSPIVLSDRGSIPDEDDSGHDLFYSHMEWDDDEIDRKDFSSDICHAEEFSSANYPAFEVVSDCNRSLLCDVSLPCFAAVAFDRSLLQNKSDHCNFIESTKYYRFFSRKSYTSSSGPHDLDVVQPGNCRLSDVSCYDVIGTVDSDTSNGRLKEDSGVLTSNSQVQIKSESVDGIVPDIKPDACTRISYERHKKNIPAEMTAARFSSCDVTVGNTSHRSNVISECERGSCRNHSMKCAVSESVDSCLKRSAVTHRNPDDDNNNNQGKTSDGLATSSSAASVNKPYHLKVKTEPNTVGSTHQPEFLQQSDKVSVQTRANAASSKSDTTTMHHKIISRILRPQRTCSSSKLKEPSQSTSAAESTSLPASKSDKTVSKRTVTTSDTDRQKFSSFRQLNKCSAKPSEAKADAVTKGSKSESALVSVDVTEGPSKAQLSILKQLQSSKGYIAEKNIKYSKSEDLFDDSSLLSREQRALRVSDVLIVKINNIYHCYH